MIKKKRYAKIIFFVILLIISFIVFIKLSSATTIQIHNENQNNEKNNTFELEDFIEKIEIKGKNAYVKDLIKFRIKESSLNETLVFSLSLPDISGINLTSSSFVTKSCSYKQINENSIVWIYDMENKNWGLFCKDGTKMINYRKPKTVFTYEMNLSKINWSKEEENSETKRVYLQIEYVINDFVLENKGEYKFLWIEGLFSNHKTFKSNVNMVHTYLILPSSDSILINPDNFKPESFDSEGRLGLIYRNSEKDSFLTYRDAKEENNKRTKRDVLLIVLALGLSIIFGFLTNIKTSETSKLVWTMFAIFLVLISGIFILFEKFSFFLLLLIIFFGCLGISSLKKDERLWNLKRHFLNIKKLILEFFKT